MSRAGASLLVVVLLFGLAVYFLLVPPPGFERVGHVIAIPFILIVTAVGVLENLRTRTHVSQLVGALRTLMGRSGREATPEVKAEAVDILVQVLRSDKEKVRRTALQELRNLTGQQFGDDPEVWESWWKANRQRFVSGNP